MLEEINLKEMVSLYNKSINTDNNSVEDYINLILIYWNATFDYGFESYCITEGVFTENQILALPKKIDHLFEKASNLYPNNKELKFWKIYIEDLSKYSECTHKADIQTFLRIKEFYLPHFYLYVQCDILNHEELKQLRLIISKEDKSYKKHYVLSYLDSIKG